MELSRWQTKFCLWKQLFLNLRSNNLHFWKLREVLICGSINLKIEIHMMIQIATKGQNVSLLWKITDISSNTYWLSICFNNSILCIHCYQQIIAALSTLSIFLHSNTKLNEWIKQCHSSGEGRVPAKRYLVKVCWLHRIMTLKYNISLEQ